MSKCVICGESEKRLIKHHTNYEEDLTVLLCDKCHRNLHAGNINSKELIPETGHKKDMSLLERPMEITTTCYAILDKVVPYTGGSSVSLNIPKKYSGHRVLILLVEG